MIIKSNTIKTFLYLLFQFILLFYGLNKINFHNPYGTYTDIW